MMAYRNIHTLPTLGTDVNDVIGSIHINDVSMGRLWDVGWSGANHTERHFSMRDPGFQATAEFEYHGSPAVVQQVMDQRHLLVGWMQVIEPTNLPCSAIYENINDVSLTKAYCYEFLTPRGFAVEDYLLDKADDCMNFPIPFTAWDEFFIFNEARPRELWTRDAPAFNFPFQLPSQIGNYRCKIVNLNYYFTTLLVAMDWYSKEMYEMARINWNLRMIWSDDDNAEDDNANHDNWVDYSTAATCTLINQAGFVLPPNFDASDFQIANDSQYVIDYDLDEDLGVVTEDIEFSD